MRIQISKREQLVTFHTCREHVEVLRGGALFEVRRDSKVVHWCVVQCYWVVRVK